ncbi:hypothetical protein LCGC14_1192420 [marine sediment metagenome]|uniref:Uncharacterized protein n=1 Tax=marine sediment metagenome TaxID=412755 RepID=A0A0F9M6R9_9ZZZZ
MELNDPAYLKDLETIDVSELECLYWIVEDALYKGNKKKAKTFYKLFLYLAKYRKNVLVQGLQKRYIERLKELAFELYDDKVPQSRNAITIKSPTASKKLPFAIEADMRDYLAANSPILSEALNDEVKIIDTEVETDCEYKCDILAEGKTIRYPVELKIGQADHAVVSQIQKYCYYFYRKYRYAFFKEIQGIVCANGFDAWSINELRRTNILIFDIMPDGDGIRLSQIF